MERMIIKKDGVVIGYLTRREKEFVYLLAWGWEKKEVADYYDVSPITVTNTIANVYNRLGVRNIGELSALWFCNQHTELENNKPIFKIIKGVRKVAFMLLVLIGVNEFIENNSDMMRARTRSTRSARSGRVRRVKEFEYIV